jgi:radical SAM protein with 4Fe4S-binding SPASM domain
MHVRRLREGEDKQTKPIYAVWEITLRCDHACSHCGSRAAKPRDTELDRKGLFEVADALVRLGTREVTLIGGEAYLHPDCEALVEHLTGMGIWVSMQTGGRALTRARVDSLAKAGIKAIGVSIDGPEEVHDVLRGVRGSYATAVAGLQHTIDAGLMASTNIQVNRLTYHTLEQHYEMLDAMRVRSWRCQLTVPMGRAADNPQWLLEPYQLLEVIDRMAVLQEDAADRALSRGLPLTHAMNVHGSNNLGYFGPHEEMLRSHPGGQSAYWGGCPAGVHVIGIESDGVVKGCPSLPTAPYVGGNVRDLSLEQIWNEAPELQFVRKRTSEELWGFCGTCYYKETCMGGCAWTAHCTVGKRGNNPFCYHRAATLKEQGLRERLEPAERAPGAPYDFGRFRIVEEPWPQ